MGEALLVRRGGAVGDDVIFIEPGLIVEFFGLSTTLPEGWVLCDGTNDTPNLINKFIIGAGDTYAIGAQGGSANAINVSHTHTATVTTAGSHNHAIAFGAGFPGIAGGQGFMGSGTTSSAGSHSHSSSTINNAGESGINKNLPPYIGLFYIMKELE